MNRLLAYLLIVVLVCAAGVPAAPKEPGKRESGKSDSKPAVHESDVHKLKLSVPGNWEAHPVHGDPEAGERTPFFFFLPFDQSIRKSFGKKGGEEVEFRSDSAELRVSTLAAPQEKIESVVTAFKDAIKKNEPAAKFKPDEKTKIAGVDARVVTVTLPGKEKGEPERMERHSLFVRDGKRFDFVLESHAYSYAKSLTSFQNVVRSVAFTAPAESPDTLLKKYDFAEQLVSFKAPKGWNSGKPCHGARGAFIAYMLPVNLEDLPQRANEAVVVFGDSLTVASRPLADPKANLEAAVEEVKREMKDATPTTEFKPVAKSKVGGSDAVVLAATFDGDPQYKEPKKLQRRVITVRDGKLYQFIHSSYVDTGDKNNAAVDSIFSSVQFTQVASAPKSAEQPAQPGAADGF